MLWTPGQALASGSERKFLFVFCPGGWDQCYLFAPLFGSPHVDMEADAQAAESGGVPYVDAENRPFVRDFFDAHADKTCIVNGIESRSVAHDVCLRLVCTGSSQPSADDWPSLIAAGAGPGILMPQVALSGPSYTHSYAHKVVRIGRAGQLMGLLDGSSAAAMDSPAALPSSGVQELEDLFVASRCAKLEEEASRGAEQEILGQASSMEADLATLQESGIELESSDDLGASLSLCADLFSQNAARCVMLAYDGVRGLGWDTHAGNHMQAWHFDALFEQLALHLDDIGERPGSNGGSLLDEVTIVVMSEMGRFPKLNFQDGKDHWTYTSAMLLGAGVRGGQAIGGYDEHCMGRRVDLASGESTDLGKDLGPKELGATLLALADIDPAGFVDADPILAAIAD